MKRIILAIFAMAILVCAFSLVVGAQAAYLEKIPAELKGANDKAEYFIVFDGDEYYTGSGSTISGLNAGNIAGEVAALGIDNGEIGTKYLTKFIFPDEFNGTALTRIDFNTGSLKNNREYFRGKCGAIVMPSTVNSVSDMNDCVGQLRSIDFGVDSQITAIPTCFCRYAYELREVKNFPKYLPGGIASAAFANCRQAFKGELYLNASFIENKAFDNCFTNVTGIVFGELLARLDNESMSGLEAGVPAVKYIEFKCDITKLTICDSVKMKGAFYFGTVDSQRAPLDSLACIVLSHPNQADCTGKTFQDYFPKVYFNEASMNEGNPVAAAHNYGSVTVEYSDFFTKSLMKSECSDCGCENEGAMVEPIVKILGYSKSELGGASIVFGIKINYDVLNEYNARVSEDKKINVLGLLVANPDLVGGSAFDSELSSVKGCVSVDLLSIEKRTEYAEIKVSGIIGEGYDYTDMELFVTAYAVVGERVTYLDNGTDSSELLTSVTYNTIG